MRTLSGWSRVGLYKLPVNLFSLRRQDVEYERWNYVDERYHVCIYNPNYSSKRFGIDEYQAQDKAPKSIDAPHDTRLAKLEERYCSYSLYGRLQKMEVDQRLLKPKGRSSTYSILKYHRTQFKCKFMWK